MLWLNNLLSRHRKGLFNCGVNDLAVWELGDLWIWLLAGGQWRTFEDDSDIFCFLSSTPSSWNDDSVGFDVGNFPNSVWVSLMCFEVIDETIDGFSLRVSAKMFVGLVWRYSSSGTSVLRIEFLC